MANVPSQPANIHVFGIRHHGPGSARSLQKALAELQPDIILVEGPPDAAEVLPLVAHAQMSPPVALLIYQPDQPQQAVYYPFALFSPEWQALKYGFSQHIPVRFMDLPVAHYFAVRDAPPEVSQHSTVEPTPNEALSDADQQASLPDPHFDPLGWLAQAAGYGDGERWWEHMVEQRLDSTDLFAAILEAMTELRQHTPPLPGKLEPLREAHMRQTIRAAQQEGFSRIAVVCGAWHAPVLSDTANFKEDATLLKNLPKVKVQATWVPWTYGRLAYQSGYGAGIESPGWYEHLWTVENQTVIRWLTKVARLLRAEDLDVSSAHIIEAVRLAETLASLREKPAPGLIELNEATQTVLCSGETLPMQLIHTKLIVGEMLGVVPDATPMVPLQQDLLKEQKRLRLKPEAFMRSLDLDLRKPTDLERSYLLHRLNLLGVNWGQTERASGKSGTFHEIWRLQWQPEFEIKLIEARLWGSTIYDAAGGYARHSADNASDLPAITALVDKILLAELPDAINYIMTKLQNMAAVASDISHLMQTLPLLANVLRYGNVRRVDVSVIATVVDGLVARITIGLPGACASLNDEAANSMFKLIVAVNSAINLLQNAEYSASWHKVLKQMVGQANLHGLLAGRCCRLLLDSGQLTSDEVSRQMGLALSTASEPAYAATWVEGFLKESGLLLLHDEKLWQVLDSWVTQLPGDVFTALLPLLRRTFATFSVPERRQMGEQVKRGKTQPLAAITTVTDFDNSRAEAVLPVLAQLLGIN